MLLVSALLAVIAFGAWPARALAAPSAQTVARDKTALDSAMADVAAANRRVASIEASLTAASAALDKLIAEQQETRDHLSSRVAATYRYGPLSFLEVIVSSADFEEFATRIFLITRINARDADELARLEKSRTRTVAQAKRLMRLQVQASREARALEASEERARAALAKSRSSLAASRRIAQSAPRLPASPTYTAATGTGGWKSAKASHYGKGSWGRRTADGTTVRSDSMIVAHKTLPFGTLVEFSFNGKRAVARVADRGPYTAGRVWDLGPGVISVLGFNGVHIVKYRIIGR